MLNYITSVSLFAAEWFSVLNAECEDVTSARRKRSEFSSEKMQQNCFSVMVNMFGFIFRIVFIPFLDAISDMQLVSCPGVCGDTCEKHFY